MIEPKQLLEAQDQDAALDLLKRAVQARSVTGDEANFVKVLQTELESRGLQPQQEEFLPRRPNIWGASTSEQAGPRLLFIGHTDTVHVDGWAERWKNDPREDPCGGAVVDGEIWGRGTVDLKGGICASIAALDLLQACGAKHAGEVAFAFVGDEESGETGTGVSAGVAQYAKRVVAGEIAKPDFAIYVEPSKLAVYTSQIGFFIADITVTGKSAYFGRPEEGIDAFRAAHAIQTAIWEHARELEASGEHKLVGRASALITSLSGGGYIAVPETCKLSLIRKLRPGESLDDAVASFEKAVRGATVEQGIKIAIDYPAGRDHKHGGTPAEIDPSLPAVAQLQQAIDRCSDKPGAIEGAPFWSEMPFLTKQIGCPAVYCAPGDIGVAHTLEERLSVVEYLAAARAFALFIADFCGLEK